MIFYQYCLIGQLGLNKYCEMFESYKQVLIRFLFFINFKSIHHNIILSITIYNIFVLWPY